MKTIVLVARGMQLGALGCYGNQWIDTPALDSLAADGIVFDHHFAANADPTGARLAWRTGRYHLPVETPAADPFASGDLITALRSRGIHTCLIVDDSRPGVEPFTQGWDECQHVKAPPEEMPLEATLEAVGAALERLEHRDNWLLWVELATFLPPWNVPNEFQEPYFNEEPLDEEEDEEEMEGEEEYEALEPLTPIHDVPVGPVDPDDDDLFLRVQTTYASAISYLDAGIGQLLQALTGLQGGEEVLLVVTTDVGQNLGEHGILGPCAARLHEELIHLPLLLRLPQGAEAGHRVSALTQSVDLAATLADWFQVSLTDAQGHSLLPLARGAIESIRPYACAGLQAGPALEYALHTAEWGFVLPLRTTDQETTRTPQLFVKPDDRGEINNVVQHHLEWAEKLERTLRDFVTASARPGPLQTPLLPEEEDLADQVESASG